MLSAITKFLADKGCSFPDIGLLQPADPFLDTTGEDLRRRIFITSENSGTMLCLRPEFTIPVCKLHLETAKGQAVYGYGGPVFRQRTDAPAEFIQAGYEDIGNADRQSADVACIRTAIELVERADIADAKLVTGDQSIFIALLEALDIPQAWRKKLLRSFGDPALLSQSIAALSGETEDTLAGLPEAIRASLESADRKELVANITDMMVADGLPLSGGRTPQSIAERVFEKHELRANRLDKDKREILESFLAIDVPLSEAVTALKSFASDNLLFLDDAVAPLEALATSLADVAPASRFRAGFGRRLDYYTGLVFEIFGPYSQKPVIGGGRYDRLLTLLGSKEVIPAVGFAVWIDRLEAVK